MSYPPNYPDDGYVQKMAGHTPPLFKGMKIILITIGEWLNGATMTLEVSCRNYDVGMSFLREVEREMRWKRYHQLKDGEDVTRSIALRIEHMPIWWRILDNQDF